MVGWVAEDASISGKIPAFRQQFLNLSPYLGLNYSQPKPHLSSQEHQGHLFFLDERRFSSFQQPLLPHVSERLKGTTGGHEGDTDRGAYAPKIVSFFFLKFFKYLLTKSLSAHRISRRHEMRQEAACYLPNQTTPSPRAHFDTIWVSTTHIASKRLFRNVLSESVEKDRGRLDPANDLMLPDATVISRLRGVI